MKILLASMQFGRGYSQGTERYISTLTGGLAAHGVETIVLAGDPEKRDPQPRPLGNIVEAGPPQVRSYPSHGWMTIEGMSPDELSPMLREIRPDVVHITNPGFIGLSLIDAAADAGIPVIASVMDFWWLCPKHTLTHYRHGLCSGDVTWRECLCCIASDRREGPRRHIAQLPVLGGHLLAPMFFGAWRRRGVPEREIDLWQRRREYVFSRMERLAAVIFASQVAKDWIGSRLHSPRQHKIPWGLEPRWFGAAVPSRSGEKAPVLGFAGALTPHKGVHLLLEALHQLNWRDARVRIAGGGDDAGYAAKIRSLAQGLNVEWVGRVTAADMPAFMRSLDALVVPSRWTENLPFVVLEASASGAAVIATDVPGIAEAVPDRRRLFPMDSVAGLAESLRTWDAAGRPKDSPPVSTAAQMCERTVAVYQQALAR